MNPECSEGINFGDMGMALFLYVLWQLLYYIKTEYQDRVSFFFCKTRERPPLRFLPLCSPVRERTVFARFRGLLLPWIVF